MNDVNNNYEEINKEIFNIINKIKNINNIDIEKIKNFILNKKNKGYFGEKNKIKDELIKLFSNYVDENNLEFDKVASYLLIDKIKEEYEEFYGKEMCFYERVKYKIFLGIYDNILNNYNEEEYKYIEENIIKNERDLLLKYSGVRQFYDKYLLRDYRSGNICESIQECNILICMVIFVNYKCRMKYIKKMYDYLSKLIISLPTPIYSGVRTTIKSYSSCCVIDCGDTVDSILAANYIIGKAITKRYGIGVNMQRVRGIGSNIGKGVVKHCGVVPILKMLEASTKSFMQNGIRSGSATVSFAFWNWEILTILDLKNNKGVAENRVRSLDYSIGINRLFLERVLNNEDITLFSSNDVLLLNNCYKDFNEFRRVYMMYENDESINKKRVSSLLIMKKIVKERYETGRVYIYFIDNMNEYSAFKECIFSSNLCQEIAIPTKPLQYNNGVNNDGLIAVCILSCINVGRLKDVDTFSEMADVCDTIVRFLNELIDYQEYDFIAMEKCAKGYRPLGIGISDLFHLLARKGLKYDTKDCLNYVHKLMECFSYNLLKASCNLAKESGRCREFDKSSYSAKDYLPVYKYKKILDDIASEPLHQDWKTLREDINRYGLKNACLSAIPPTASSCSVSNSTPGIDPPKEYITTKVSKHGTFKQIVPEFATLKNYYTLQKDIINEEYFKLIGVIQKFIDQSISTNSFYLNRDETSYNDIFNEIYTAYNYGLKTLYYLNSNKGVDSDIKRVLSSDGININKNEDENGCESGACSI